MSSPNMNLPVPVVGTTAGPEWAQDIVDCLDIIDAHDHTPGYGVQITPSGIDISSDLEYNNLNAIDLRSVRFANQTSALTLPADLGCLYELQGDLYFKDAINNNIRITQNGGVAGSPGSISNLVSPASANYVAVNSTFVWQSDINTPAIMDSGPLLVRKVSAGSNSIEITPPSGLGSDYSITLLATPPSVTSAVTMDTAGNLGTSTGLVPPGIILAFGGTAAPANYLLCDGTLVSRSTYSDLFSAVGTAFGSGDGSTTFALPDLRGQFLRGVTGASSKDPDASSRTAMASGGNTGNNVGSIQSNATAKNGLALSDPGHFHVLQGASSYNGAPGGNGPVYQANFNSTNTTTVSTGVSLGAGDSETRPTNAYVNYIIKT